MFRGVVVSHDAAGLWVRIAEQGVVGPLPWIGGNPPADGNSVLIADAGMPGQPDLIVLGTVTTEFPS